MKKLAAGSLVTHRTLGTGRVVAVEATALHVFFPTSDTRYAAKLRWPSAGVFLSMDDPEPDPWLEGLSAFALDTTSGRYALAANFVSQDEAVAAYLADHPATTEPPTVSKKAAIRLDRRGRWRAASAAWTSAMGDGQAAKLLEDGQYPEISRRLLRIAGHAATIPGMLELEVLAEALAAGDESRQYIEALVGFLSVPSPARARFDKLATAAHTLGVPPEAAWPMVTFFPFVALPSRHALLLPRSACAGASRLGSDLRFQPVPNWSTYGRLRDLSARLLEKLAPGGATDNVDVEVFLHATGSQRPATAAKRAAAAPSPSTPKGARAAPRRTR